MEETLEVINGLIREEKGNRVTLDSTLLDADMDSFGITMLFLDLDDKYDYFKDIPADVDPFTTINYGEITIQEIVDQCILTSTTT